MRSTYAGISAAALAGSALADTHYFFSGFFSGNSIVGIEFDDSASTLTLVNNVTISSSTTKWITLDEKEANLYVTTDSSFSSFSITSNKSLEIQSTISIDSGCSNTNYISALSVSPYTVIGTPFSVGCPSLAISVDSSGNLNKTFANVTYDSSAGVHGTAISPDNDYIYSADDSGNAVWVHGYDSSAGDGLLAINKLQKLDAPTGYDPRHLVVHPNGKWVYVVYEAGNGVGVFSRDNETGLLTDTNTTYSVLPSTFTNSSSYWADEIMVSVSNSSSPKYLIAATRARDTSYDGYVTAFSLDADTGAITEQLFILPTNGSGGKSNAVAPAKFSEEYFGITDSGSNFIEIWKIDGSSASSVAHMDFEYDPANIVWL